MQEIIEKIVRECPVYLYKQELRDMLIKHLTNLPLDPSQFVNGEPEEDGEYVCKVTRNNIKQYYLISIEDGIKCPDYFTILSHCKLP